MTEKWRDIPGFEGLYQVSDEGRVKNARTQRILKSSLNHGYPKVGLSKKGKISSHHIYTLVMLSFVGPCPDGCEIDHINFDRTDSTLKNLRYVPYADNRRHKPQSYNERVYLTPIQRAALMCAVEREQQGRLILSRVDANFQVLSRLAKFGLVEALDSKPRDVGCGVDVYFGLTSAGRTALDASKGR